jgi:hypothetical protein
MSEHVVGSIIDRLLTDEELRIRFAVDPVDALAELHLRGFRLTPAEIDAFMRTDARTWSWTELLSTHHVH